MPNQERAQVCDYEGSTYRTDFWTPSRAYEDAVERVALEALLPSSGRRLIEVGAGFGRLADLYAGYQQVVLFDYARSILEEAHQRLGGDPRFRYVVGDFNALPFVDGLFDTVTMVRVIHHAPDVPAVLKGIQAVCAPGGTFVLEFANKRNLKAIARWLLRRQDWNPFEPQPYEFVELNFDFHPGWMLNELFEAGFLVKRKRTVSHLRLGLLKRALPTRLLVALDRLFQPTGRWWQLTPSVFVAAQAPPTKPAAAPGAFFRCPVCRADGLSPEPDRLRCAQCGRGWWHEGPFYDFKRSV